MKRVLILGAAGRDFHNSKVIARDNPVYAVAVEELTKPGPAELLAAFTHEREPALAGVRK